MDKCLSFQNDPEGYNLCKLLEHDLDTIDRGVSRVDYTRIPFERVLIPETKDNNPELQELHSEAISRMEAEENHFIRSKGKAHRKFTNNALSASWTINKKCSEDAETRFAILKDLV